MGPRLSVAFRMPRGMMRRSWSHRNSELLLAPWRAPPRSSENAWHPTPSLRTSAATSCASAARRCRQGFRATWASSIATSADRPSSFVWRLERLSTNFGLQYRPVGGASLLGAGRAIAGPPGSRGFHRSGAGPIFASQGNLVLDTAVNAPWPPKPASSEAADARTAITIGP
jgi:hypothetical protein